MYTKKINNKDVASRTLQSILNELRLLRSEVLLLLPQDTLEEYSNSVRIKKSYHKALKKHPPSLAVWR